MLNTMRIMIKEELLLINMEHGVILVSIGRSVHLNIVCFEYDRLG